MSAMNEILVALKFLPISLTKMYKHNLCFSHTSLAVKVNSLLKAHSQGTKVEPKAIIFFHICRLFYDFCCWLFDLFRFYLCE